MSMIVTHISNSDSLDFVFIEVFKLFFEFLFPFNIEAHILYHFSVKCIPFILITNLVIQ